ncbi:MAG: hypothetical protein JWQ18_418 [Conexibacter sp.]|nr:hypothetical protein [Conexibacter sp.]
MLRVGIVVVIAAAALGVAALAFGQDVVPIKIAAKVKVTPDKAGTPAHPQGVRVDARITVDIPHDIDPPLVQSVDVWFPKGGLYNGAKWPTCNLQALRHSGPKACPARSIMGHGRGVADADGTKTYPTLTVVNGGANAVYFWVVLRSPARVQEPIPASIEKLTSGRWSYHAHANIPRNLQIVAGIPLRLDSFHAVVGRGDWIATTSCPKDHLWRYHAETHYDSGQNVATDGSVACRS